MTRRRRAKGSTGPTERNQSNGQQNRGFYSSDPKPIVLTHHESSQGGNGKRTNGRPTAKRVKNGRPINDRSQPARPAEKERGRYARPQRPQRRQDQADHPAEDRSRRQAESPPVAQNNAPAPFDLFAAYHLGITADGKYKAQNLNDIARRFNLSSGRLKQLLIDYGIDSETMINADFDMAMAQLDMMVAPPGIDRRELAKTLYQDFLDAPKKARDWQRELAEDAEINRRTFGS